MKSFLHSLDYIRYNDKWMLCTNSLLSPTPSAVDIRSLSLQISFIISRYGLNISPDKNLIYEKLKELNFEFADNNSVETYSLKIFFNDIEQFDLFKEWLEIYLIAIKLSQ